MKKEYDKKFSKIERKTEKMQERGKQAELEERVRNLIAGIVETNQENSENLRRQRICYSIVETNR